VNTTATRPDIVVLMTDTQPKRLVGCYGNPGIHTPHLDALAANGTRFTRAYTASPLCTPARSAFFTGIIPSKNGAYTNSQPLGDTMLTLGQRLRDAGYRTAHIGKWHLDGHDYFGTGRCPDGWEDAYWYDGKRYLTELSPEDARAWRTTWSTFEGVRNRRLTSDLTWGHRISDRAERFLHEDDNDPRPRLLVANYDEPHHPWTCPPEFVEPYLHTRFEIGPNAHDDLASKPAHQRVWARDIFGTGDHPDGFWHLPMMAGCTTYVDTQIGRVIASARARAAKSGRPLWIIFCSDHGDHFGAHRLRNKGPSGYEENIGVPLIVWASDRPGGVVQPSVVNLLDVLPTLLEIAGLPRPPCLDGTSFASLVGSNEPDPKRVSMTEYTRYEVGHDGFGGLQPLRAFVRGDWKLVINLHQTDELYNLATDPYELRNLIDDPAHSAMRDALHCELSGWMHTHIDPQRGHPWDERPWHCIARPQWKAAMRPIPPDGYAPPYIDYDTGLPTRGTALQQFL
jgi:uncharacterized sulfatase